MQGLGNDFVLIDNVRGDYQITPALVRHLSDRHYGIGCNQLLVVEPPELPDIDFNYRIFNQDGSEVEQCGNGARCFMRFVLQHGLTNKTFISVKTKSGIIELALDEARPDYIRVNMGKPAFDPTQIPFVTKGQGAGAESGNKSDDKGIYQLALSGQAVDFYVASMGNPHAVSLFQVESLALVDQLGEAINQHPQFPSGVNLSFMSVLAKDEIDLLVYERGAGRTLACGTAACAAVAIGQRYAYLDSAPEQTIKVNLPGGSLYITQNAQGEILMSGPAEEVFVGKIQWHPS